jgi:hypothetical protein
VYGKIVCAFSWELALYAIRIWQIWGSPGASVVAFCGMLNFDYLSSDSRSILVLVAMTINGVPKISQYLCTVGLCTVSTIE